MAKRNKQTLLTCGIIVFMTFLFSFNCFSQDSNRTKRILYVERTRQYANQTEPTHKKFTEGNKVAIKRYSNDTLVHGKIEAIEDSSIIIKGKIIFLKDIKSIHVNRKPTFFIVGGLIPVVTSSVVYVLSIQNPNNPAFDGPAWFLLTMISITVGVGIEIVGIIDALTVKHYHLDKDFIMTVKTVKKK
jgi:hypothetical protein